MNVRYKIKTTVGFVRSEGSSKNSKLSSTLNVWQIGDVQWEDKDQDLKDRSIKLTVWKLITIKINENRHWNRLG